MDGWTCIQSNKQAKVNTVADFDKGKQSMQPSHNPNFEKFPEREALGAAAARNSTANIGKSNPNFHQGEPSSKPMQSTKIHQCNIVYNKQLLIYAQTQNCL